MNFQSGRQNQHPELGCSAHRRVLRHCSPDYPEEVASDLGLKGWAQRPQSPWPLTSVGDDKDDVLAEGLRAGQSHLGTDLLHHIQGHLEGGKGEARPAELTPVLPVAQALQGQAQSSSGPLQGREGSSEKRPHAGRSTASGIQILSRQYDPLPLGELVCFLEM